MGVSVAIRSRSLRPIRVPRILCPRPACSRLETEPFVLGPVTSLDVLDADPPRAPRSEGAGRAFTRCVPTSDASCRHPAPARRLLADRQLQPRVPLSSTRSLVDRETRIVPPSPRSEEPSPLYEKMEERPEAPAIVPVSLPASADASGVSSAHTRRLSAPDRVAIHAFPVTFWREPLAPIRSSPGETQCLCGAGCVPRGPRPSPPFAARPL